MLPSLNSLQKLATEARHASKVSVHGRLDAEVLEATIEEAHAMSLRLSIYVSL